MKISFIIIYMRISQRLLELRKERGLTYKEIALAIGASSRAVSYWEAGINEPKATYVYELAKFFGVSADYLLGLED